MVVEIVIKTALIKLIKNRCYLKTYNSFWEKPIDVDNKVQTRAQLKKR